MATFRAQTSNSGLNRALTPVVGDLFVMFVVTSGNTNDAPTCTDDSSAGDGTYHLIDTLSWNASGNRAAIFVRNALLTNTTLTTVSAAVGTATTTFSALIAISGMSLVGAASVRQYGAQENQPSAGTAQPVVASPCLTANLTVTALFSNDFSQTPPTGWTERVENGVPPCINICTRDSGYTGTGEPYNATPSTVFAAAFIEFEAGAGGGGASVHRQVIGSRVVGSPIIRRMRR